MWLEWYHYWLGSLVPIKNADYYLVPTHYYTNMTSLRPRSGQAKVLDDYVEAEVQGHRFGECRRAYPRCPFSIANLLGAKWDTTNTP